MGKLMRNGEEIGQLTANITYSAEGDTLGDAAASDVVAGKTFSSSNGVALTGTLPNLSTATTIDYSSDNTTPVIEGDQAFISTNSDGTQRVVIRYNGSTGVINGNTLFGLASSKFGNASATHVLSGKTFTSPAGLAVAGTMTNNGAVSITITPSTSAQTYTIPAGYHSGSGKVTVRAISEAITTVWTGEQQTSGTVSVKLSAYTGVILYFKNFWNKDDRCEVFQVGTSHSVALYSDNRTQILYYRDCSVSTSGVTLGTIKDADGSTSSETNIFILVKIVGLTGDIF